MSNHPPFDDPHKSPEDYWRIYPGTMPMDSHDRPTAHSLAELSHITEETDAAIDRASLPVPGCTRDDQTPEEYLDSLGPPKRDTTPCDAVTAPPPRDTLPAEAMDPEDFIPAPTLRQMFAEILTRLGRVEEIANGARAAAERSANQELQVIANKSAIAALPCRNSTCPRGFDKAAE